MTVPKIPLFFLLFIGGLMKLVHASTDFDDEEERNFFMFGNNATTKLHARNKCISGAECVKHSDCGRKQRHPAARALRAKGAANARYYCKGLRVGKCDCSLCKKYQRCNNDDACGGLIGSCKATGHCDCYSAAQKLYAANHVQKHHVAKNAAYMQLCYTDNCESSDDCFGLPCLKGECACAAN